MPRPSLRLLLWLVPGLLALPVVTPAGAAGPAPVPVAPAVVQLSLEGVDRAAAAEPAGTSPAVRLGGQARRRVLLTPRRGTARFGLLGVT